MSKKRVEITEEEREAIYSLHYTRDKGEIDFFESDQFKRVLRLAKMEVVEVGVDCHGVVRKQLKYIDADMPVKMEQLQEEEYDLIDDEEKEATECSSII